MNTPLSALAQMEQRNDFGAKRNRDWFSYVASWSALAPAGSSTYSIQFDTDSVFYLVKTIYYADDNTADPTLSSFEVPNITLTMTDTGAGRNLSDVAVPLAAVAGTPGLPFLLPAPRQFAPGSTFSITATNNSVGSTTYNLYLVLGGYKRYT